VKTWLLVAAERREFDGFAKRLGGVSKLQWPDAKFAVEGRWRGDRWWLVANGPGPESVDRALGNLTNHLGEENKVDGIVSTGYCGALDPALRLGDIVVSPETHVACERPYRRGLIHSIDRVAVTVEEKRALRTQTGADAVEMEAAAVQKHAEALGIPFSCIRVVSDTAHRDLPLDFNRYRIGSGDFSRTRIALAALARPFTALPRLIAFARESERASEALGDFLADCRF
jgi:adenosylhomocysteine nucleosidase